MDVARYLRIEPSGEMQDRSGRLMYAFLNSQEQWCFARDLSEISPRLIQATIAAEDRRFYRHCGVDPLAVLRAVWQNLRHRRIVSGASTLTMQVVKQSDKSSRSLSGKIRQSFQALRLERRATKAQILRAYLNTAPYGLNLVGCEAAARRFFGKPACELTLAEAALIAGLPKTPTVYTPVNHPDKALKRRNYILRRMLDERYISSEEFCRACRDPLGAGWYSFPTLAPHLAMRLKPTIVQTGKTRTTLDQQTQMAAEHLVKETMQRYAGGIEHAALLVMDGPSASVLARVGSPDFFDEKSEGQVDNCRSPRSPGSALKPFTYALAIERNCLYASETLLDSSLDYGLYDPENFDRRYRGLVSASDALRHSLNVPAVTICERVGCVNIHSFLRHLGLSTLTQPAEHYGLGLTLGNCEVELEELAGAYCALANLGEYRPLQVIAGTSASETRRMLSRGTCLEIYNMLEQALPDELGADGDGRISVAPRVAWKTGTSTGHRDAWAFMFNRHYVVGVWMGNSDGRPSPKLVGAETALPLAAKMFRSLQPKTEPTWPEPAGDLCAVRVCAVSGLPASSYCRQTSEVFLPRNQYLNRLCDMHYPARRGSPFAEGGGEVIERWPGSPRGWNLARITAPVCLQAKADSAARGSFQALRILCPADKAEYVLTGEANGDRITLRASLDEQVSLHWYLDDRYLGASNPRAPLVLDLKPGKHKVGCMTPDGTVDKVQCEVFLAQGSLHFKN
jgi:penicillin-binding protein 1C